MTFGSIREFTSLVPNMLVYPDQSGSCTFYSAQGVQILRIAWLFLRLQPSRFDAFVFLHFSSCTGKVYDAPDGVCPPTVNAEYVIAPL